MKIFEQDPTFRNVLRYMRSNDYVIETDPFKLNIVGVRNAQTIPNKFDDDIYVFYKNNLRLWEVHKYPATTDAGTYYLLNPYNQDLGTAMIKEGQYKDSYQRGDHRGYLALVQAKPITVYRDYDRNALLDFNNGKEDTGLFGINIHRANAVGTTKNIDKYSAGCQVFENADDFAKFLELAEKHNTMYGNNFTYTLVDERALNRAMKRKLVYLLGGIGAISLGAYLYKKNK